MNLKKHFVLILIGGLATKLFVPLIWAEDKPAQKPLSLPKSATGAAYVLGRLSNKELIEWPRSEFVYVALLQRKGLDRKFRLEALEGLTRIHNTDSLTELIVALETLDKKKEDYSSIIRDLSQILLQSKPEELIAKQTVLAKLSTESQLTLTRQIGFAAIVVANNSVESIWKKAQPSTKQLVDLIRSIELIRNASLRSAFYPKVEPLLHENNSELRRAAIFAIAFIPHHDVETFTTLGAMVRSEPDRAVAIESLQKISRKSWVKEQASSLLEILIPFLKNLPAEQRTQPDALRAFQFASDLVTLLPPEEGAPIGKTLRSLGVSIFVIRSVPEQMLFDKTLIVVEAGKPVEIIFQNEDAMPHNLVVVAPGALEEIGQAAEKLPPTADALGRPYVPASAKVLHATPLVEPGQQTKLSFTAPELLGEYQYVCTFPGHWRRMVGTIAVVKDVESYLANHSAEPKNTEWKTGDFETDIGRERLGDAARGKNLFTKLACAGCHKFGKEGTRYGPDLTDVFKRYNSNRVELLRHILEPSLIITNRYRNYLFQMESGEDVSGMIVKEDGETFTVQTGPSDNLIQILKRSEIKTNVPQSSSLMPLELLNTSSKQDIFDLLAWLESDADDVLPKHHH